MKRKKKRRREGKRERISTSDCQQKIKTDPTENRRKEEGLAQKRPSGGWGGDVYAASVLDYLADGAKKKEEKMLPEKKKGLGRDREGGMTRTPQIAGRTLVLHRRERSTDGHLGKNLSPFYGKGEGTPAVKGTGGKGVVRGKVLSNGRKTLTLQARKALAVGGPEKGRTFQQRKNGGRKDRPEQKVKKADSGKKACVRKPKGTKTNKNPHGQGRPLAPTATDICRRVAGHYIFVFLKTVRRVSSRRTTPPSPENALRKGRPNMAVKAMRVAERHVWGWEVQSVTNLGGGGACLKKPPTAPRRLLKHCPTLRFDPWATATGLWNGLGQGSLRKRLAIHQKNPSASPVGRPPDRVESGRKAAEKSTPPSNPPQNPVGRHLRLKRKRVTRACRERRKKNLPPFPTVLPYPLKAGPERQRGESPATKSHSRAVFSAQSSLFLRVTGGSGESVTAWRGDRGKERPTGGNRHAQNQVCLRPACHEGGKGRQTHSINTTRLKR